MKKVLGSSWPLLVHRLPLLIQYRYPTPPPMPREGRGPPPHPRLTSSETTASVSLTQRVPQAKEPRGQMSKSQPRPQGMQVPAELVSRWPGISSLGSDGLGSNSDSDLSYM